jgi:hypothetical protein
LEEHFVFSSAAALRLGLVYVLVRIWGAAHFVCSAVFPGSYAAKWKALARSRGCYRRDGEGTCLGAVGVGELDWPLCLRSIALMLGEEKKEIER